MPTIAGVSIEQSKITIISNAIQERVSKRGIQTLLRNIYGVGVRDDVIAAIRRGVDVEEVATEASAIRAFKATNRNKHLSNIKHVVNRRLQTRYRYRGIAVYISPFTGEEFEEAVHYITSGIQTRATIEEQLMRAAGDISKTISSPPPQLKEIGDILAEFDPDFISNI